MPTLGALIQEMFDVPARCANTAAGMHSTTIAPLAESHVAVSAPRRLTAISVSAWTSSTNTAK